MLILWCNCDMVVPREAIQKAIKFLFSKSIQHLINERHGEVIFLCCRIHLAVIHTNFPPRDCLHQNQFIFLILYNSYPAFLRSTLDQANTFIIYDQINYPYIKPLNNLFLDDFFHRKGLISFGIEWCSLDPLPI